MKGNDGSGNIPERDTWETNKELFEQIEKQYKFDFDCCASEENTKCQDFSQDFIKRTILPSRLICWMNPPFSKAREMFEHYFKVVSKGICIYRCDNMETKIWQEVILPNVTWIFIPKGRVNYNSYEFKRPEGVGARFPSALIGFNVPEPKGLDGCVLISKGEVKDGI